MHHPYKGIIHTSEITSQILMQILQQNLSLTDRNFFLLNLTHGGKMQKTKSFDAYCIQWKPYVIPQFWRGPGDIQKGADFLKTGSTSVEMYNS